MELAAAPNWVPPMGTPAMEPASTVRVILSEIPSSAATLAIFSGAPVPRLTMAFSGSSMAARRAMIFLASRGMGGMAFHGDAELAGEAAVIGHAQALFVVLNRAYHNGVHIDTGNCNQFRIQRAALDDLLHLDDDLSAGVLAGLGHGGDVDGADLPVDGVQLPYSSA